MNQDDREYLKSVGTGIRAEFKACTDLLSYKIDEVITNQKSVKFDLEKTERETKFARWIQRNPKISIAFFILSVSAIVTTVNVIGLKEVIKMLIK